MLSGVIKRLQALYTCITTFLIVVIIATITSKETSSVIIYMFSFHKCDMSKKFHTHKKKDFQCCSCFYSGMQT